MTVFYYIDTCGTGEEPVEFLLLNTDNMRRVIVSEEDYVSLVKRGEISFFPEEGPRQTEILYATGDYRDKKISRLREEVQRFKRTPRLDILLAKDHSAATETYVNNKKKIAAEIGIHVETEILPDDKKELTNSLRVGRWNDETNGVIVQLPFYDMKAEDFAYRIPHSKDVDGFHPVNVYKNVTCTSFDEYLPPCTPKGAIDLLEYYGYTDFTGKHCVVVGRSDIVGKPMANILINRGATVTVCNSSTNRLTDITRAADFVFLAIGKPKFFTRDYFNGDAVIVDFGINRDSEGKLCGDLDTESVHGYVKAYTPTPKGTGVATVLALMENVVKAYKQQNPWEVEEC